jgi:hypothetical protein
MRGPACTGDLASIRPKVNVGIVLVFAALGRSPQFRHVGLPRGARVPCPRSLRPVLSGPVERLLAHETRLEEIFADLAREKAEHGTALARAAGFDASPRVACGKTWEMVLVGPAHTITSLDSSAPSR